MMKGYDNWHQMKNEVMRLYLLGKDPRHIAGLTGVPRIRIEHEMAKATERNPDLLDPAADCILQGAQLSGGIVRQLKDLCGLFRFF